MNILQVSPRYPPATGGIERHVKEISERLVDAGHSVTVVTMGDTWRTVRERENGVSIVRVPGVAPNNDYHVAPTVALAIRRHRPDLVHAHGYHSFPLLFAAAGAIRHVPFVATPHYLGPVSGLRGILHGVYRPVGRFPLQYADECIAVSEWEQRALRDSFGVDARVVPNGIDVDRYACANPHPSSEPYILSASRLVQSKGVQYVIEALDELPELQLKITGTGQYERELRRVARKAGVTSRVDFLGYVSEDRLASLYAGAMVHVTLSDFECYGLTVGESLAAGTPVVVHDVTALSEWTDLSGCLGVRERDPETVAGAIHEATDLRPDPTELTTWDEVVGRLLKDVYSPLLDEVL
ncbi:glycosyltransferase [Halorubrum sp. JWXQ-INN 858]|uniref:glycosyltransferase family 4 protein n=1 Tax=Halorubrum sp. JWXQ-INN 858 TaxID=2690782 RepID=UPI00135B553E|nr:glycosyltransferase family 4 protein [Halorubrum sp. JWXQ-INN 858]MWV64981.1 glycosyltransferase [Halorubrum sp. JWXQ-INN 858]